MVYLTFLFLISADGCSVLYATTKAYIKEEQYFETMYAHPTTSSSDLGSGLKYVKSEMHVPEIRYEEIIPPVNRLSHQTTCGETESDPDMKSEVEAEQCSSGKTRHWVVCEGGVLKEIKVEPTDWNPDTLETSMCNENIDQEELCNKTNDKVNNQPTNVWPYVCGTCGKSFKQKSRIIAHESVHTMVKPYTCATCGKSFKQKSHLTVHGNVHTTVKPYTCVSCGKSFKQKSCLTVHERIHTMVKPYMCVICGKSFKQKISLTVHERVHTMVKPYTCVTCEKSFKQKIHLTLHERIHSKVKPHT